MLGLICLSPKLPQFAVEGWHIPSLWHLRDISLLLRAGSENRVRGIQKEVVECVADVVTFGLAVLHVVGTRLVIFTREVNSDRASTGEFSKESGTNVVSELLMAGTI